MPKTGCGSGLFYAALLRSLGTYFRGKFWFRGLLTCRFFALKADSAHCLAGGKYRNNAGRPAVQVMN